MIDQSSIDFSPAAAAPVHNAYIYQTHSVTSNLAHGNSVQFTLPKSTRFYEPASAIIIVEGRVVNADGSMLAPDSNVFLKTSGVGGLWERVVVAANGEPISTESSFNLVSGLHNILSYENSVREGCLAEACQIAVAETSSADITETNIEQFRDYCAQVSSSKPFRLQGPISPFLMSSPLLLPSGTELSLRLDRCADALVLGVPSEEGGPTSRPRLELSSVTLMCKAWELTPGAISRVEASLGSSGGGLMPSRAHKCTVHAIPAGSSYFRWTNVYDSNPLPDTVCLVFLKETSFLGNYSKLPTHYEPAFVKRVAYFINQIAVLPGKEYNCTYRSNATGGIALTSDASEAYYGFLDHYSIPTTRLRASPLPYRKFLLGNTMYLARLPTAAAANKNMDSFDVGVQFAQMLPETYIAVLFSTESHHIRVDRNRQYRTVPR